MNDGEKLFRQGSILRALIMLIPIGDARKFLLEEVEREIFLGLEIIEECSLGDFRLSRNRLGGGRVEAFLGEKGQCSAEDSLAGAFFFLLAFGSFCGFWASNRFHTEK